MAAAVTTEPLAPLDRVRNQIAIFLVGSFVGALGLLMFVALPEGNKDIVTYMVGQLSGMTTTALGLYFAVKLGQETLDAKRADTTARMADAVVAAAATTPANVDSADGAQAAADGAQQVADEMRDKRT